MDPKQKKILIAVVLVVVLAVLLGIFLAAQRGGLTSAPAEGEKGRGTGPDVFRPDNPQALPTVEGGTREVLSERIATPDPGATDVKPNVAVPVNLTPVGSGFIRTFELKGEGDKIVPDTIVVNDGDLVKFIFTAVDKDYVISFPDFGLGPTVKKGESARFQLQATPFGEYKFTCSTCKPVFEGRLLVNKK